ncbi:MAG: WecB/TagA/CpsF family glycosyltransferase [Bryobacteraceae bacterium]|jgi:N-acetylglucosaminyldiphosphoundecaprenol N-acetyl-beta-D-mannosaminyltransferase
MVITPERHNCSGPQLSVLGTLVSATSYGGMLRLCRTWIEEKGRHPQARYAVILNVHSVMTAWSDRAYAKALNTADAATPDGMPLVWALRSLGAAGQRRVYGPDLMLALCGQATRLGHRLYLYGGREETLPVLRDALKKRFPALHVAGMHSPPFRAPTPEEDAACVCDIAASGADIVFVGIGVPKQERWMYDHRGSLAGVVMFGVGAAFDFHAGTVRQAPAWMQGAGLEWLFRLCMEPRRLWKRYVLLNPLFLLLLALQLLRILRYPPPADGRSTAEQTA